MRVIYLCTDTDRPSGGHQVIHSHVEILRDMGIDAWVYRVDSGVNGPPYYRRGYDLTSLEVRVRQDFLVLPEKFVPWANSKSLMGRVQYAIYIQNPYLSMRDWLSNAHLSRRIYGAANRLIYVSEYTREFCKALGFSHVSEHMVYPLVEVTKPQVEVPREKAFAFMPRKLPEHARIVIQWIRDQYPDWKVFEIDGMRHEDVLETLRRTSIFLSFSHAEGVGLPPVEAALCGCQVVGYKGGAGADFFESPIFYAVEEGNYLEYFQQIQSAIASFSASDQTARAQVIQNLSNRFSRDSIRTQLQSCFQDLNIDSRPVNASN